MRYLILELQDAEKILKYYREQYWGSPVSLISGDWCGVIKSSQNTYEYFLYFFLRSIYLLYFKVDYWQYDENKRKFFEKFAKRRNFDLSCSSKLVQYFDCGILKKLN